MNKGDIIYLKYDVTTHKGTKDERTLTEGLGYEVIHVGLNYVSVYCWVNGNCQVFNGHIDFNKSRNYKIDKLLDET